MNKNLTILRSQLPLYGVSAYVQPVHDEFLSEYPPACFKRVQYLSGFSGSAGTLVVACEKAALFVDGRYILQAAAEVDKTLFEVYNSADVTPETWLVRELTGEKIGYDAALFTPSALARFKNPMVAVPNLVDVVWKDRPAFPITTIFAHEEKHAGESSANKCTRIASTLKEQGVDAAFIAAPESACWLLNIRARDVECTPLVLARALLFNDGKTVLLRGDDELPTLAGKRVLVDESNTTVALITALEQAGAVIVKGADPCTLPKACKNAVQLAGIRAAHARDGVAVKKFLAWIDGHHAIHSVSEIDVANKLLSFRKENDLFVEPSFPTIAGSGGNGAIVHYRANEKTNRTLKEGELLLLDSGGQYLDGTTDITRTIAIGTPSAEHKERFTRVLKGHIALATAVFPRGTRGSQLDALARQHLWKVGLDYDHGTGHGVGQFLGVHEGPQRISKRAGDAVLEVGMILSNEPGYYKTGEYGIRIENLVVVVPVSFPSPLEGEGRVGGGEAGYNVAHIFPASTTPHPHPNPLPQGEREFLKFETLTRVPFDEKLIDYSLLTEEEKIWVRKYQVWAVEGD